MQAPFFNASKLVINNRYVAWLDVMGTRSIMTRSLGTAANFVFKLHVASLQSPGERVELYPMNDGVFGVSNELASLAEWLVGAFQRINLANQQVRGDQTKILMVRAAIAFGPVTEGIDLPNDASYPLSGRNSYIKDAVMLGAPVVNAYESERKASPFGIYVHESARTFAPGDTQPWSFGSFLRYWEKDRKPEWVTQTEKIIEEYLEFCRKHSNELEYPESSIDQHTILMREYFSF